jgi:hypothetical protein
VRAPASSWRSPRRASPPLPRVSPRLRQDTSHGGGVDRRDEELQTTHTRRVDSKTQEILSSMRNTKLDQEKKFLATFATTEESLYDEVRLSPINTALGP